MRPTLYAETVMTIVADARELAERFFHGQDALGGPFPADMLDPGYRAELTGFPVMTAEQHAAFGQAWYGAFPGIKHFIDEAIATDDGIAVRFTARGRHTGAFMGIPATGKDIAVSAVVLLTISDGKVTRLRGMFDQFGLMRQLGVVPA